MDYEALKKKYQALLTLFDVRSVQAVNHKPHPFMVGARHVIHVSKHRGGLLGEETCRTIPCAHQGCTTSYEGHTSDKVLFLQLKRSLTHNEAKAELQPLGKEMQADGLDGLTFVDTPEKFRIGKSETPDSLPSNEPDTLVGSKAEDPV